MAANEKGIAELGRMTRQFGPDVVRAGMGHVRHNAEESVRHIIAGLTDGTYTYGRLPPPARQPRSRRIDARPHEPRGFDGADAVQTHMADSRLTDPEVLGFRHPVRVERRRPYGGSRGPRHGGPGAR